MREKHRESEYDGEGVREQHGGSVMVRVRVRV